MAIWNERIRSKRLQKGITLAQIADKLGVTEATAQRYESGSIKNIPYEHMCAYGEILGCSPAYLMGWSPVEEAANAIAGLADTALKTAMTPTEAKIIRENSYENLVIKEMGKMNQKGKVKLLDTAREMVCNPLYNPDYEIEVNAAHIRTDIDIPEGIDTSDDDIMSDDNF